VTAAASPIAWLELKGMQWQAAEITLELLPPRTIWPGKLRFASIIGLSAITSDIEKPIKIATDEN
jgi:hypothetical protein